MEMTRFKVAGASPEELQALREALTSLAGVELQDEGDSAGAPFAELVVVALIAGGASVVSSAITVFGSWLASRGKKGGTEPKVQIVLTGLSGSRSIDLDGKDDAAKIASAADEIGPVREVAVAGE